MALEPSLQRAEGGGLDAVEPPLSGCPGGDEAGRLHRLEMLDDGGARDGEAPSEVTGDHRLARQALEDDEPHRLAENPEEREDSAQRGAGGMRFRHAQVSAWTNTFGKRGGAVLNRGRERGELRMINGAHVIVYSKDAEADKAFLKNVLKFNHVDAVTAG